MLASNDDNYVSLHFQYIDGSVYPSGIMGGGAFFLLGVFFFKLDGRLPLAHAIWHLFVVFGAVSSNWTVRCYLVRKKQKSEPNLCTRRLFVLHFRPPM